MHLMKKDDFLQANLNSGIYGIKYAVKKLADVAVSLENMNSETEKEALMDDLKYLCEMIFDQRAILQDAIETEKKASELPETVDIDSMDMTPFARHQLYFDEHASIIDKMLSAI